LKGAYPVAHETTDAKVAAVASEVQAVILLAPIKVTPEIVKAEHATQVLSAVF